MPCLTMSTAVTMGSPHSLIRTLTGDARPFTRMILRSTTKEFRSVGKATLCAGTEQNPRKDGRNSNALKSALPAETLPATVKMPAPMQNTAGRCTLSWKTTQGFLMTLPAAARSGNRSIMQEPLQNVVTNERK